MSFFFAFSDGYLSETDKNRIHAFRVLDDGRVFDSIANVVSVYDGIFYDKHKDDLSNKYKVDNSPFLYRDYHPIHPINKIGAYNGFLRIPYHKSPRDYRPDSLTFKGIPSGVYIDYDWTAFHFIHEFNNHNVDVESVQFLSDGSNYNKTYKLYVFKYENMLLIYYPVLDNTVEIVYDIYVLPVNKEITNCCLKALCNPSKYEYVGG